MPASPETIEQLARDVVRIADGETALRALTALRHELEQIEIELVARALQGGASWSQIGRSLGVTKQAAHRRHRDTQPPGAQGGPKILVTSEARRCIQLAREDAHSLAQPTVATEHILLGILRCQQSHAVRALNHLGVTHEAAKAALQPAMAGVAAAPAAGTPPSDQQTGVSPDARRILEGSLHEALKRREGYIGVEHILLAILSDSRNGAMQTLEALSTTPAKIRRQLEREWQTTTATQEQPATPKTAPTPTGDAQTGL